MPLLLISNLSVLTIPQNLAPRYTEVRKILTLLAGQVDGRDLIRIAVKPAAADITPGVD